MSKGLFENRILIVDDNGDLRRMLGTFLKKEGYQNVALAEDCRSALSEIGAQRPDFIILDINLPDGDGFQLMKAIRQQKGCQEIPVLFLSARDQDADRLRGLELGADDYMMKPFLPRELLLRMGAILRRSYGSREVQQGPRQDQETRFLELGPRVVDFEAGTVRCGDREEPLTVKELHILKTLAENRGKIVTFDNLCKAVWNAQYYTYENTVMVHIRRLREKIEEDPSKPKWLVTARGIGYKLK